MEFADLRAFARIADLGSVSGAARSLGMPKSSVSRSLVRLEAAVGAALIERSTRHLRMTDAGMLLHRHARRILDDVGEAENAVSALAGVPGGTLRVSVPFTFAVGPLAPMLPLFLKRHPAVRVVLTVDNRLIDLFTEEIDVAIRIGPLRDSELIARHLATFALWLCASPAYLAEHGLPGGVKELAGHSVISHVDRLSTWRFHALDGRVQEIDIEPGTVVPEPAIVRTMLIGGAGIGWLPDFHAVDAITDGRLVRVLPHLAGDTIDAHALYASHRSLSAEVRVFIDALVAQLAADC